MPSIMLAHIREVSLVRRSISLLLVSVILAALLSGCGFKPISIELRTSAPLPLRQGDVITITAVGKDSGSKERPVSVTWSADPAQAGTFSKLTGSSVTFTASASYTGDVVISGVTDILQDTLSMEVYAPILETLTVSPASWTLADGGSKVFTASGTDQHGRTMAVSPEWSLSGDIGWVDPASGLSTTFYATALGTGTLTATQDAKSGYSEINVIPTALKLSKMEIAPASWDMAISSTKVFEVFGYDQYGGNYPITEQVYWEVVGGIGYTRDAMGWFTTEFVATVAGEGHLVATSGSVVAYADISVTSSFLLSGRVEDSETDTPVAEAEVRAYVQDEGNGILVGTVICDASGLWSMELQVDTDARQVVLQAGAPGYFVRTKGYPIEDTSGILMRIVPDNLDGFLDFVLDVWWDAPGRFDSTNFQGFKILTQNPTGNGTFTQEQAEYLRDLALDSSNNIEMILNTSGYPVVIDPIEPYSPGINKIYVLPDTDRTIGTAEIIPYGFGRVNLGGVIKINPTGLSEFQFQGFLFHELGHLIYSSHPTTSDSIMHTNPLTQNEYQPLDIKGTYISNEPTFIGMADGADSNAIDYVQNILGTEWGLDGLIGY